VSDLPELRGRTHRRTSKPSYRATEGPLAQNSYRTRAVRVARAVDAVCLIAFYIEFGPLEIRQASSNGCSLNVYIMIDIVLSIVFEALEVP
jgi:hypothetical protein